VTSVDGSHVVAIASGSVEKTYEVKDFIPSRLFAEGKTWGAFDASSGKLATLRSSSSKTYTISGTASAIDANLYGDNLYILSTDGITRIADAALGKQDRSAWLTSDTSLPADPTLMIIDGSVYVIGKDGTLAIYYRGKKTGQFPTGLAPKAGNLFVTSAESVSLYLVDQELNRIHVIDKKTGELTKTLKISGTNKITDVTADNKGTVFILTKDNKVWKI
jgi:DNA-binding beta-propeller fold protein YncE